jgi:signal transduction histidine kinase/signal recognition particle receptor subunit beta
MVQFRNQEKEILFKIVYYGPALGGKTTNIESLHEITDPEGQTKVTSLKTAEDRTLFFDLLPFDLGDIQGYHIRVQIYTVPGQVHYNTTRKIVLSGADSIVFVADSQADRLEENFIAWENMKANLLANKMNLDEMPVIIQCNKRDLENIASPETMLKGMKISGETEVALASAIDGDGVVDTFRMAVSDSLGIFVDKFRLSQKGVTKEKINESLKIFFEPFERERLATREIERDKFEAKVPLIGLSEEEQLAAALRSTTELAEQHNELERLSNLYQAKLKEMTLLYDIGISISSFKDCTSLLQSALRILSQFRPSSVFSLFYVSEKGTEPLGCFGADEDPLFGLGKIPAKNLALALIEKKESTKIDNLSKRIEEATGAISAVPESVISLVIGEPSNTHYVVLVYEPLKEMLREEEHRFFDLFERLVSPRILTMGLMDEIARTNDTLERKVIERTAALSQALDKLKELDTMKKAFLNSASHEMKTPLTNIKSYSDFLIRHPEQWLEKGTEYLGIIKKESEKLENLITSLLSFSYVKEPFRGESSDLVSTLNNVLQTFSSKIKAKKIQVLLQKDKESLVFPINKEDASVFMQQIIDNAVKYTPEGTTLKIFLMEDTKRVIFSVRDYGEGFPQDKHQMLSEDSPTAVPALQDGLGMGLFFVKEVLKKYAGTMHIDNMVPGTNVLIEIPKS